MAQTVVFGPNGGGFGNKRVEALALSNVAYTTGGIVLTLPAGLSVQAAIPTLAGGLVGNVTAGKLLVYTASGTEQTAAATVSGTVLLIGTQN